MTASHRPSSSSTSSMEKLLAGEAQFRTLLHANASNGPLQSPQGHSDSDGRRNEGANYIHQESHEASAFTITDTLLSEFAVDETLMSDFAINEAFQRYQSGADLYLVPMTRVALEDVLRRYARDALHNTISLSRFKLAFGNGSYGRILQLLYDSISSCLDEAENVDFLLDMHRIRHEPVSDLDLGSSSVTRWIKIK